MQFSQLAPLPSDLPFKIISKTIGQGAYACIKKAVPLQQTSPVFAVKFIHKDYATRHGRITPKQINLEVSLHSHVGHHDNIIKFYQTGEDPTWRWIAMELAEGGDLFDKIESDVGVGEDIAHFYFTQLMSAIGFMHSKGVGHRDIKPENVLLSADGDLKIADFGLATLFEYKGQTKMSTTLCGSPPYIAPEVITCSNDKKGSRKGPGYRGDLVDIWSCGVVLFVLLVGNTPWDSPTDESYEYSEYVNSNGHPSDELWDRLPSEARSLLRGMMCIDANSRHSLEHIRQHPWFTRPNSYLSNGRLANPIGLATSLFESLKIDFENDPLASQSTQSKPNPTPESDSMEIDSPRPARPTKILATQPETPSEELNFDWERPSTQLGSQADVLSSQLLESTLAEEPSMSQFSARPSVPLSRTQLARRFKDIVPAYSLTQFHSAWPPARLFPLLLQTLNLLEVKAHGAQQESQISGKPSWIRVTPVDERQCLMKGDIVLEDVGGVFVAVNFVKMRGDPVEWRRFFKKVTVLCKDAVYRPDE